MRCDKQRMQSREWFLVLCIILACSYVRAANLPCAARQETAGYVCVCNNTYCDTVERPKVLKSGKYYHYVTSATQPGFNVETGSFSKSEDLNNKTTDVNFKVDASLTYQTFSGVGAGLSDSAAINFFTLSEAAQAKFIESYFAENGLEYVFGRVPIGCSDFSTRTYSYDDVSGDKKLKNFALAKEDLTLRIPMIKQANAVSKRGLKLVATPWTSPSWMKTSNTSSKGFIKKEYEATYAKYLIKYLNAYKNKGVDFWALSQGNEVVLGYLMGNSMPNLALFPPQLKTWTRDHLGPLLKNSTFRDLKVITLDDERDYLRWYSRELLDDKKCAKYIDGAALHWYGDNDRNTNFLDEFYAKYSDKFLIFTESSIGGGGPGNGIQLGKWSNAERYIESILQNFNHFVIGYIDWNIALNTQGGPSTQMSLDSSVIINSTSDEFYKEPFFYVLGHFSKFITPGAQRINVTSDQNSTYTNTEDILNNFVMDLEAAQPSPPGPGPTGQPGPGPRPTGQPGPGPTGQPGPGPQPTSAPATTLLSTAALNPDGSHTFIVYNPTSDSVTITVKDSIKGTFKKKISAQSLNTFIYW